MITAEYPEFFRILSGQQAPLFESIIVSLYDEIYRGSMGEVLVNRSYIGNLISREMLQYDRTRGTESTDHNSESVRVQNIITRMIGEGWLERKFDQMAQEHLFNFTKTGRKIAQVLHQMNSKNLATRHRNVRTTLGFLEAYLEKGDPYDLIDAFETSDYIVSDLMDQINEIHEVRKNLVRRSMESVELAGGEFFDFLEKEFGATISIYLTEDSVSKYASRVKSVINDILEDEPRMAVRNKALVERYPNLDTTSDPVEDYILQILQRVESARQNKIPQLVDAIDSLFKSSEIVLKQAGALMVRSSSAVRTLALLVKESEEDTKEHYLESFAQRLGIIQARLLDPRKIVVKSRLPRRKIKSVVLEEPPMTPERKREIAIRNEIRKALGYTAKEVEKRIAEVLMDQEAVVNAYMPIETWKHLNASLHAASIARKMSSYEVKSTGKRVANRFYETDEYLITKKDH